MPKNQRTTPSASTSATLNSKSNKHPVSGLSNTSASMSLKGGRKTISHRHPNDKLPPLPQEGGNKNNYVMDPIPLKQKTSNQQNTNL
jgi:protein expanded